ncbi:MAG: hypothetical protein CME60_07715 [Halobacteriovoraceae bacterium]|nr:hypothetical protein [Halobacteriovoraceae bacterium]
MKYITQTLFIFLFPALVFALSGFSPLHAENSSFSYHEKLRGDGSAFTWNYHAFSKIDKSAIDEVLASEGGKRFIKSSSFNKKSGSLSFSLEEVDAILYDQGFFDFLKHADPLLREMLVRKAMYDNLYELQEFYLNSFERKREVKAELKDETKSKLKSLSALFRD